MNRLVPYLTFNGNCREAMTFYQSCLGGELNFQTIGESPLTESMPEKMKNCILLASLKTNLMHLMATDMAPDTGLIKGNTISLLLPCPDEETLLSLHSQLKPRNKKVNPTRNHEGGLIVQFTDKFGVQWFLNSKNSKLIT
ncbi:MAG: VOC family protein [Saprospiraceae bacterium]|nr:VOC family protein [Saprospiraceae bacterium]